MAETIITWVGLLGVLAIQLAFSAVFVILVYSSIDAVLGGSRRRR